MNKLRYPEKRYLSEYDLSEDFFEKIGVVPLDITPLRKVFIIKTYEGKMILKKLDYNEERFNFINSCIDNIKDKFHNIISFRKFEDGNSFIEWKDQYYILMDLIPGREAAFTNPIEFEMSAKLLANMHLASKEKLDDVLKDIKKEKIDAMDTSMVKKIDDSLKDIVEIKNWVEKYKYKDKFDNKFLKVVDEYIDEIEKSKELLSFSGYSTYRSSGKNIVVCHNDLAQHNFLINEDEMFLIDFDYCTIDLRINDLADLILKGIKNAAFDIDKALKAIEAYNSIYPLDREEYKILYILLLFPRDIYSIVKSYYHREKSWEEEIFINRFDTKLRNEQFRREFLNQYKIVYKDKFY